MQKHKRNKHPKKYSKENAEKSESAKEDVEGAEFTEKVNDFLKSFNYLNNAENNYSCDKCDSKFASQEFLNIHVGATHK